MIKTRPQKSLALLISELDDLSKTTVKLTRPEVEEMAAYYRDKIKSISKI